MTTKSQELFTASKKYIPGGVNSPVRAFAGVNGEPIFIAHAEKAYLFDVDGKQYLDFVGSWGPMILGHNDPDVANAVKQAVDHGLSYGAPTAIEYEMAKFLCENIKNMDMVRMVSSGTEATMSAIRLARGYTKRNKFIKFVGCYHGHSDALLVKAGSGALTLGVPSSSGVTVGTTQDTLLAIYNDLDSVATLFAQYPKEIAAIIVEPVAGNMNCVPGTPEFLQGLRQLCNQYGAILIFDEVMTGFRVSFAGSQAVYNVDADLITLGKIIGGGMPVGAFGGKHEIMECLAPLGTVYQAGTLSGNPVAMAAGLTTLTKLKSYPADTLLRQKTQLLLNGLKSVADRYQIPFTFNYVGGMFGFFFSDKPVQNFADVEQCNVAMFKSFHTKMLRLGYYFAPSAFEAGFISLAHSNEDLQKLVADAEHVFHAMHHEFINNTNDCKHKH